MSSARDAISFEVFAAGMTPDRFEQASDNALRQWQSQRHTAAGSLTDDPIRGLLGGIGNAKLGRASIELSLPAQLPTPSVGNTAQFARSAMDEAAPGTPGLSQDVMLARMRSRREYTAPAMVYRRPGSPKR